MNAKPTPLIGCCGWAGSQTQYFSQFHAVEIQSTFYDPPASKVATRWRATAPSDFEFCIKAWQLITHSPSSPTYRRLRRPIDAELHRQPDRARRVPVEPLHATERAVLRIEPRHHGREETPVVD